MSEFPHRTILKITLAIREADEAADIAEGLLAAEILKRHLDQDVDVLSRHEPIAFPDQSTRHGYHYCFWCSEDGNPNIYVDWPCPEIRSVAKAVGVEL